MFSPLFIVTALSLFSCTRAVALGARGDDCTFCCPKTDAHWNPLSTFSPIDDKFIRCVYDGDDSYGGKTDTKCIYNIKTGDLVGDNDDCLKKAKKDCDTHYSWEPKRDDSYPSSDWPYPSDKPYPTDKPYSWSDKPYPSDTPYSWSTKPPYSKPSSWPKPSSYPPWKPTPSEEPCSFSCPIKDLVKNPLTDEAIRTPSLFCSYSSPKCQTCNFCEYDTKTGKLKKDNDDW